MARACCDEADGYREGVRVRVVGGEPTVIFRSWWAASDGYHLSLVDPSDLRSVHLIWDGPVVRDNPTGGAVVWLVEGEWHLVGALLLAWPRDLRIAKRG